MNSEFSVSLLGLVETLIKPFKVCHVLNLEEKYATNIVCCQECVSVFNERNINFIALIHPIQWTIC